MARLLEPQLGLDPFSLANLRRGCGRGATWSRGDDVTLANPSVRRCGLGPGRGAFGTGSVDGPRGRASPIRKHSEYSTGDLGYNLELEWTRAKFGGAAEMTPVSLRATTIFRREEGEWKIVYRHADPITTTQPAESVIQQ
jgi:ketosteroid isomerase-like protein